MHEPVRVLSLDGGPGPILHLFQLREVEARHPGFLRRTRMFAGTSDGALVSLFLAMRLNEDPDEKSTGLEIITACIDFATQYSLAFGQGSHWLKFLRNGQPVTDGVAFERVLRETFGTRTLGDLQRGRHQVAIASFDSHPWRPRLFRSFGSNWTPNLTDDGLRLVDVALCTASLPGVTPLHHIEHGDGYMDGFLSTNNPAMSALSVVYRDILRETQNPAGAPDDPFQDILLLSMGVGQSLEEAAIERQGGIPRMLIELFVDNRPVRLFAGQRTLFDRVRYLMGLEVPGSDESHTGVAGAHTVNWGWLDTVLHATYVFNMMVCGQSGELNHMCERLLGPARFHRYEPRINLMRSVSRFLFQRGHGAIEAMKKVRDHCFRAPADATAWPDGTPYTVDELANRERTARLLEWVEGSWMADDPQTVHPPQHLTQDEGLRWPTTPAGSPLNPATWYTDRIPPKRHVLDNYLRRLVRRATGRPVATTVDGVLGG